MASETKSRAHSSFAAAPNRKYGFIYDTAGHLINTVVPTGGRMRWDFGDATFSSNRTQTEVKKRYLAQDAVGATGGTESVYTISHEASPGTVHSTTNLVDATNAAKVWTFTPSSTDRWRIGLLATYQMKASLAGAVLKSDAVTWDRTPTSLNPYPSVVETAMDGQSLRKSRTQQTLDQYGNVKQQDIWDYPGTARSRIYKYAYLHEQDGTYANHFIRNRVTSKAVSDGNDQNAQTLQTAAYDLGACTSYNYSPPADLTNAFLHDPANRTSYLGNASRVASAGNGQTCMIYDVAGNVYVTEGPGRPQQQTSYAADSNFSAPSSVTLNQDSASLSSFSYTPWLGVSSYSGPNGASGSFTYDAFAQPSIAFLTTGGRVDLAHYPGAASATYFPGAQNGYPWMEYAYIDSHWSRKTMDGLGRVVREEKGIVGQAAATSIVDSVYAPCACSPVGKLLKVSQPYVTGATVYWTSYSYDGMGRTLAVTGPDGLSQTKMTYNAQATGAAVPPTQGSSVTTVDPKGNWKVATTDVFGNVLQVQEPNPQNAAAPFATTYTYDKVDHLLTVAMPRNGYTQTRRFAYNAASLKLTSETHPETGTTTYSYFAGAHGEQLLQVKQDAKGQQTKMDPSAYDVYNRANSIKFLTPGSQVGTWVEDPCQRVNFTYDTYPAVAGFTGSAFGRVTTSTTGPGDATAACQVDFDANGRTNQTFTQAYRYTSYGQIQTKRLILSQTQTSIGNVATVTGKTWDMSYTYDDEGYQTSTTYPTGQTQLIGLDSLKRPSSLGYLNVTPIVQSTTYNAAGQMTSLTWGHSGSTVLTETRGYNAFNQLAQIQTQINGTPSVLDLNYGYPAGQNNGQVASVTSGLDAGANATYGYDQLLRLTSLTGAHNQSYTYDGWGNLSSKTGDGQVFTMAIDSATNRLVATGVCYDANGNMTASTGGCPTGSNPGDYAYDVRNRLVKISATQTLSAELYFYTADNKRVSSVMPNGTTKQVIFIYGAKGELGQICTKQFMNSDPVCDANGPTSVSFAGRIVQQDGQPTAVDRVGSVAAYPLQGVKRHYYPYGESPEANPAFPGNSGFASYFRDYTRGLDYADQRYYANQYGRFMSADPYQRSANIMSSGTWNKYSYVSGNPVNYYDPQGLLQADPNDPGDSSINIGTGFLTGYGPEGSYTYVGTTVSVTGSVNTQVGGGSGVGSTDYRMKGLLNGYQALYDLWKGANLDSEPCQSILRQLYAPNGRTGVADVVTQIEQTAYTIFQQGWLFDGASSNTQITTANFGAIGGNNPSTDGTVGGFFAANPTLVGLSQKTGYAIWIRSAYGENVLQAQDTILHEVLHKIALPFSVDKILDGDLGEKCFRNH